MKKLKKQFVAAIALCLIAVLALGTSTFAWFSMNTAVSATGMQVKAKAESGIVIANEDTGSWTATASAKITDVSELLPTSTSDASKWYHSSSSDAADANAHQTTEGAYAEVSNPGYYVENLFYIKSATKTAVSATLKIKEVKAEVGGTANSGNLDKSLRVGIKVGNDTKLYIFAPVDGATLTYYVANAAASITAYDATKDTGKNIATAISSIPTADKGLPVYIYTWFEGEDASCISNNVTTTLDSLTISVSFSAEQAS